MRLTYSRGVSLHVPVRLFWNSDRMLLFLLNVCLFGESWFCYFLNFSFFSWKGSLLLWNHLIWKFVACLLLLDFCCKIRFFLWFRRRRFKSTKRKEYIFRMCGGYGRHIIWINQTYLLALAICCHFMFKNLRRRAWSMVLLMVINCNKILFWFISRFLLFSLLIVLFCLRNLRYRLFLIIRENWS